MVRKRTENADYGRPIVAESGLWPYVKNFGQSNGFITGLILGQHSSEKDYVVHLARTPRPSPNKDVKVEKPKVSEDIQEPPADGHFVLRRVRDIRESWFADHAKHVTRMLPGGVWVLGIFLIGPEDPFSDNDCSHLRSVLQHIKSTLNSNQNLQGNSPSSERIVLYINPATDTIKCRITDLDKGTAFLPGSWAFEESPIRWQPIECCVQLDSTYPLPTGGKTLALKKQLEMIVNTESSKIRNALCKLGDELRNEEDTLGSLEKKPQPKVGSKKTGKSKLSAEEHLKTIQASLYVPMISQSETMTISDCSGVMNFTGTLASKVFLNPQATIKEAAEAVKQDVVRSLASRLDMHWDSLIEEEHGSPEESVTLHEPPRRVLIPLPHSQVAFSDYLFPGEGPEEALVSSQELLDISVEEAAVQKELELHSDPNVSWEAPIEAELQEKIAPSNTTANKLLLILAVSLIVLVLAIAVKLMSKS